MFLLSRTNIAVIVLATFLLQCGTQSERPASAQDNVRRPEHQFVASSQGQVYYALVCDAWQQLAVANRRYFVTAAAAESAGYTPSQARGCAPQLASAPLRLVPARGGSATCVVASVVDGDTFRCRGGDRIRLLLIDTPEMGQSPLADSARVVLASLIPVGVTVRLDFDVELRDQYERILAYVYRDSLFVNREIVRRGLATTLVIPPNVRLIEVLRAAADSARRERRGIWRGGSG